MRTTEHVGRHSNCNPTTGHGQKEKLRLKTMASGTLSEPPPTPPPTAFLNCRPQSTSQQHVVNQAINPLDQIEHGDRTNTEGDLAVSQRPASTQPTVTNCLLPYIDAMSEAQSSPFGITNIPQDLLLSLKRQQERTLNPLSPPRGAAKFPPRHGKFNTKSHSSRAKQPVGSGVNILNKPPANVWNYPQRRARLRHLTEAPPCVCGAGRDISFLYDSPSLEEEGERVRAGNGNFLPNTLIPEEYHIVKHPGVLGLEFHDE